jgi:hypothetical protein
MALTELSASAAGEEMALCSSVKCCPVFGWERARLLLNAILPE